MSITAFDVILNQLQVQIVWTSCCVCNSPVALTKAHYNRAKAAGTAFYCPNGHELSYRETELDRAKQKIAQQELQIERERRNAQFHKNEADRARRSTSAIRGHLTRQKKRIANGVCPCCKRTFHALARHMKTKHPDFFGEHEEHIKELIKS